MAPAILVLVFLFLLFAYLRQQKAQERRAAYQKDLPREELLPHHYKSFVQIENTLWANTRESERHKWDTEVMILQDSELHLVRQYVDGLRSDFARANRIFSAIIIRSPDEKVLIQLERQRLKIEFPYYAVCALVRFRLWRKRVAITELRLLTELVSTIANEVRSMLNVFEQSGRTEFVERLLRNS